MTMTPARRWTAVVVAGVLLVAVPLLVRARPAAGDGVSAARLLALVRESRTQGWSGYVETQGTLALPSVDHFDDVASLFGGSARLRVWWQDDDHWRVDRLATTGETDLIHTGATTVSYDYEDAEAKVGRDPSIRLPRTADLLPPALVRRAIDGVHAAQVSRLPARRVAGVSAPGLRVTPASPLSSVDHVDLWADPESGVPLRVEVYADPHGQPSFTSAFRDFSASRPADARVAYHATATTEVRQDAVLDIADAANQYAPLRPPASMAGLPQSTATDGAVGVYGSGLTQLIAIPLRDREADALRDQLDAIPGVVVATGRTSVQRGVLGVMLTGQPGHGGVLITGTVNLAALARAADDAVHGYVFLGDQ